jgi:hypothetical protein
MYLTTEVAKAARDPKPQSPAPAPAPEPARELTVDEQFEEWFGQYLN